MSDEIVFLEKSINKHRPKTSISSSLKLHHRKFLYTIWSFASVFLREATWQVSIALKTSHHKTWFKYPHISAKQHTNGSSDLYWHHNACCKYI